MSNPTLLFIILCFVILAVVWISSAFSTKRTVESSGGWLLRIIAVIIVGGFILIQQKGPAFFPVLGISLWPQTLFTGILADIIVAGGLFVMIMSRRALGRNWSADIVYKENHELITRGPYSYVRHPIYSGLLLMILGIAIYSTHPAILLLFTFFCIGAYFKALKEEEILTEHFPQDYPAYKLRVKALIPFIF